MLFNFSGVVSFIYIIVWLRGDNPLRWGEGKEENKLCPRRQKWQELPQLETLGIANRESRNRQRPTLRGDQSIFFCSDGKVWVSPMQLAANGLITLLWVLPYRQQPQRNVPRDTGTEALVSPSFPSLCCTIKLWWFPIEPEFIPDLLKT